MSIMLSFCLVLGTLLFMPISSKPDTFRLGGLFPVFKTEKNDDPFAYDSGGHNRFAGMYIAIQEINDKTDGYYDDLLPDTNISIVFQDSKRDAGVAFFEAFDHTTLAFNGLGVHAVIGAASSGPSANAQLVCAEGKIPQISYSASSPALSNDVEYPYFARTVASDDFQANVIVDLVYEYFDWNTVATIAGTDLYSTTGIETFQSSAVVSGLEVLGSKSYTTQSKELFQPDLIEIKDSGVRIIVMFAQAADGLEVIEQAEKLDMFGMDSGFVWIFSDTMANSDFESLIETYGEDLIGTFYVQSASPSGDAYDEYIERLQSISSKLGTCESESDVDTCECSIETDADGNYLWIRDHDVDPDTSEKCVGIDFPSLTSDSVNTYNPYAYDATVLLATAVHRHIEVDGVDEIDPAAIFEHLVNVTLNGITGYIDLGNNANQNQKGDRLTGLRYDVKNFISLDDSLEIIGDWTPEGGYSELESAVFPTSDNSQPSATVVPTCAVGEVLPAGSQVCLPCEFGSFSKLAGESSCHDCPVGAVCHGGSHIKALRGYWRFPDSHGRCETEYDDCSLNECELKEACDGDILLATQSTLLLDSKEIYLGQAIDASELDLLDEFCYSDGSYSSDCIIVIHGYSFNLENSPDAIQNDEKILRIASTHEDKAIGPISDAEVYLSRPEQCGTGYDGNLCAQCDVVNNYGLAFGLYCDKCPESLVATYFIALAGVCVVAAVALAAIKMKLNRTDLEKANKMSVVIKVFMSWGQLTTFFMALSLNWPFSIASFLEAEDMVFNLGDRLISVDCIFNEYANVNEEEETSETMVYDKIGFFLCLPVILVLVVCGIWAVMDLYRVSKIKKDVWDDAHFAKMGLGDEIADGVIDMDEIEDTLKKLKQRSDTIRVLEVIRLAGLTEEKPIQVKVFQETYIKAVHQIHIGDAIMTNTILFFLFYPSVSLFSFRVFTCVELDDDRFFLEDDLSVECLTPEHTKFAVGIGLPAMVFYVLGIPLLMMYMIYRERKSLASPHNMLRIGFLYEGYAQPYWWWEGWVMLRKFGAIIFIVFTSQIGSQSATVLVLGLLLSALFAQTKCEPFGDVDDQDDTNIYNYKRYPELNRLETFSLLTSIITLMCGLMFEGDEISSGGITFFLAVCFIVNIAFVMFAFRLGFSEGIIKAKEYIERKTKGKIPESKKLSSMKNKLFQRDDKMKETPADDIEQKSETLTAEKKVGRGVVDIIGNDTTSYSI